ncbi:MAG TPA: EAL domain-containing protein, partial [Acidimicrobiales bacterium]
MAGRVRDRWARRVGPALGRLLPAGNGLPEDVWNRRHTGILTVLWLHVPFVLAFAVISGTGPLHAMQEALAISAIAIAASATRRSRRVTTVLTAIGLLTCSAVLVHLSGGVIEVHFHYFVMVGVITLYQQWPPFLVAIGYVILQHGVAGALDPHMVYNHPDAIAHPWRWATVHGIFILAMSSAGIVSWRLNEQLVVAARRRELALAEAQRVSRLGSWTSNRLDGTAQWSDEMFRLLGLVPGSVVARPAAFLSRVAERDRPAVVAGIESLLTGDAPSFSMDFQVDLPAGSSRWLHGRWRVSERVEGEVRALAGTLQDVTERTLANQDLLGALSLHHATIEATADGILVVDLAGKIVTYNRRFAEMWRVPAELLDAGDDEVVLTFVSEQLADPSAFFAKVEELYGSPDADSTDLVEFADGRVFERNSCPQRVEGSVVGRVWSFRDITDRKRLEQELAHQAFHDSLTNLANQALFRDRVNHSIVRSARNGTSLAVLFIDLDNFKTVNDSLGHTAGDELLVRVTERILGCVRESDTVARLGGDEFAVLLDENDDAASVVDVASRIIASVARRVHLTGQDIHVTASVGIAFGAPDVHVDQLLRNADLAMYTAKRNGKGRHDVYAPEMHAVAVERLELENDLRRAIERGELVVHYQPIVALDTLDVRGVEALVRWEHPTRGLVAPLSFIALAEETGLIEEVGRFVLARACNDARALQLSGLARHDLSVSVNLAPRQLLGERAVADVVDALAASGLDPSTLVLEITEGAMMTDPNAAIATLDALKGLGVRLAVDDFGTGYSSLSYLQRFPIDLVKIDRSFVECLLDSAAPSLAPAIIRMAQSLDLAAVAA